MAVWRHLVPWSPNPHATRHYERRQVLLGMIAMAGGRTRTQQVDIMGVRCLVVDLVPIVRADDNLSPAEVFTHHVAQVRALAREGLQQWDADKMKRALAGAADIGLHLPHGRRMRELVLIPQRRLLELRLQVRAPHASFHTQPQAHTYTHTHHAIDHRGWLCVTSLGCGVCSRRRCRWPTQMPLPTRRLR